MLKGLKSRRRSDYTNPFCINGEIVKWTAESSSKTGTSERRGVGELAQSVRAVDCQSAGWGFESLTLHNSDCRTMNRILEELRAYFATHTRGEILKDWKATEEYDAVGTTADEVLKNMKLADNYNERYVRMVQSERFQKLYHGKSLGETISIE